MQAVSVPVTLHNDSPAASRRRTLIELACAVVVIWFGGYELIERNFLLGALSQESLSLLHLVRGIVAVVIMTWIALSPRIWDYEHIAGAREAEEAIIDREERRRAYLHWFIRMRWLAAAFTLALTVVVTSAKILDPSALPSLAGWWFALVLSNLAFTRWLASSGNTEVQMITQLLVDLVVLTGLLNASGGLENPLYAAYLFHIIIAGILLPKRKLFIVTAAAIALFVMLSVGELLGVLPHFTLSLFPREHAIAETHLVQLTRHAAHDPFFVAGRGLPFIGVLILTAYFTMIVIERLRESEQTFERAASHAMLERLRLESVIETAGLGLLIIDAGRKVLWSNERARTWLPRSRPTTGEPLLHAHDMPSCIACMAERVFATGERTDTDTHIGPIDSARHFHHSASPLRDSAGAVLQVVHVVEEITRQKELEAEALHAGKLAVLGQMSAGIAHEIGNPLASLSTRLHLMARRAEDAPFVSESIDLLKGQLERVGRIVRGVSQFARNRSEEWTRWDVNAAVAEAVKLVRLDPRANNILIREHFDPSSPAVVAVKDQMIQVVLNLLLNAVEAMPDGGIIEVATSRQTTVVSITVSDSGPGMEDSVRQHVFDPFFTTKQHGTGLGLSICQTLVHAHGGIIKADSQPGAGSRFTIILPLSNLLEQRTRLREALA